MSGGEAEEQKSAKCGSGGGVAFRRTSRGVIPGSDGGLMACTHYTAINLFIGHLPASWRCIGVGVPMRVCVCVCAYVCASGTMNALVLMGSNTWPVEAFMPMNFP